MKRWKIAALLTVPTLAWLVLTEPKPGASPYRFLDRRSTLSDEASGIRGDSKNEAALGSRGEGTRLPEGTQGDFRSQLYANNPYYRAYELPLRERLRWVENETRKLPQRDAFDLRAQAWLMLVEESDETAATQDRDDGARLPEVAEAALSALAPDQFPDAPKDATGTAQDLSDEAVAYARIVARAYLAHAPARSSEALLELAEKHPSPSVQNALIAAANETGRIPSSNLAQEPVNPNP